MFVAVILYSSPTLSYNNRMPHSPFSVCEAFSYVLLVKACCFLYLPLQTSVQIQVSKIFKLKGIELFYNLGYLIIAARGNIQVGSILLTHI